MSALAVPPAVQYVVTAGTSHQFHTVAAAFSALETSGNLSDGG